MPRKYGHSLFRPVDNGATCENVGVHKSYCACNSPIRLPQASEALKLAAEAGVKYLNDMIPKQCSKFVLIQVKGGGTVDKAMYDKNQTAELVVEFITSPGEFVFEATVQRRRLDSTSDRMEYNVYDNIQRLSQFNTDVSCVQEYPVMQLYCYCSDSAG